MSHSEDSRAVPYGKGDSMENAPKSKLILFDLDGTVYLDGVLYPGAAELFEKLKQSSLAFGFLTNNSSIGPDDYVEKLNRIGLGITLDNVVCSCQATCRMLRKLGIGPKIYILGTEKLRKYMAQEGFVHTYDGAEAVLIGFDKELTYDKLREATELVMKGTPLYASHPDPVCPPCLPDAGMLMGAFKAAAPWIEIKEIAGKPYHWMADYIVERFNVTPQEVIMVGDRPGTDIQFGFNFGMRTMMVLNGEPMPAMPPGLKPSVIVPRIGQLLDEFWPENLGWC